MITHPITMKPQTIGLIAVALGLSCAKDDAGEMDFEPFEERIIYSESFDSLGNWNALPDGIFDPDPDLVSVDNGLLKLTFDPALYGAAWLGAELEPGIQEPAILHHLGIRITLDQGYFQRLTRWTGNVGSVRAQSTLRLDFNGVEIYIPNPSYGGTSTDVAFEPDAFKIEGYVFELLVEDGNKVFRVDGVEHPLDEVYFNVHNMVNKPLSMQFTLGHMSELDPRVDHLFVDRIEVFTWTGDRPD
jgi:hypothetical protein